VKPEQPRDGNNRAESSHRPTRQRARGLQRVSSAGPAHGFLSADGPIAQHFRPRRHRCAVPAYGQER